MERAKDYRPEPGMKRQSSSKVRTVQRSFSSDRSRTSGTQGSTKLAHSISGTQEAQGFFGNALNFFASARGQLKSLESKISNQVQTKAFITSVFTLCLYFMSPLFWSPVCVPILCLYFVSLLLLSAMDSIGLLHWCKHENQQMVMLYA